jgi:hypothetical protein
MGLFEDLAKAALHGLAATQQNSKSSAKASNRPGTTPGFTPAGRGAAPKPPACCSRGGR